MRLDPGTRLGPYEIVALIGAGGMGAVYKARDDRLAREVAIKVVGADRLGDAGLVDRLQQEARAAAALNHPNIVAVFDVGVHHGTPYVVSELLEGETLGRRLSAGRLPIRKAVEFARDVAGGLAAAHARGIVHRDLKPENVFITADGRAKVLDFGLAKVSSESLGAASDAATALQTLPGVVMGTVGYMSPEQVAGRPVDHRTDIFNLGTVLHEMVTGRRTFERDTAAQTMAAILEDDPGPASSVNPSVPPTVDRMIQRCLEKSPADRFQSASDLAFALSTVAPDSTSVAATAPRRVPRYAAMAAVGALSALAAGIGTWSVVGRTPPTPAAGTRHFTIDTAGMPVSESNVPLALSPDGTKLVVSLGSFQGAQLHLRSLERTDLQPVPGTIDAFNPFFSPDGEWIGFFTTNELKRAPVSGGAVQTICRAGGLLRGGATWAPDGTIYFTPYTQPSSSAGPGSGVFRVPASGGEPAVVTSLADGEIAHRDPVLLPGGRALLFTVVYGDATTQVGASFRRTSRVVLRSLETGAQRTLIEDASSARYVSTGHVLYMKRGVSANELLAVPFDVERLEVAGAPALLSDAIDSGDGYSLRIALAGDGTLAYLPRAATDDRRSLVWVDRRGAVEPLAFGERWFETPRLSPDGSRIAALVRDRGQSDVWVQERAGALSRLTFDGVQTGLVWTPDGGAVTFSTLNGGKGVIVSQQVDGDRASRQLYAASRGVWPGSWSRDGRMLAFMEGVNNGDVNLLRDGESTPTAFVNGSATEWGARLSPDERWMAYSSNESGRWQVYAKPYPGPGERRLISNVGGSEAVWSRTGRELFYRSGTKLMAVDIQPTPAFSHAEPRLVFDGPFAAGQPGLPGYDVSLDGQRFLMVQQVGDAAALRPIHLVLNWHDELRRRTAATR